MGTNDYINKQRAIKVSREKIYVELNFKGFFSSSDDIPDSHGVYAAFAQKENEKRLLYIGRAYKTNNLKKRIQEHIDDDHNSARWKEHYNPQEEFILYSYAVIDNDEIIPDIEKTLINRNKPEINSQDVDNINIEALSVILKCVGDIGCLKSPSVCVKAVK